MKNLNEAVLNEARREYNGILKFGAMLCETSVTEGGFKELFEGELAPKDHQQAAMTAVLMENTRNQMMQSLEEAQLSHQVSGFSDYIFPMIRAAFTDNAILDLVSTQSMTKRNGTIFFLNYIVDKAKGAQFNRGDRLFDAQNGYYGGQSYTDDIVQDEAVAVGDGTATTLTGNLSWLEVIPGTVAITAGAIVATDNGNGGWGGAGVSGGSIDYVSGSFSITYAVAPANGLDILSTYRYNAEYTGTQPRVAIQIQSSPVQAKSRDLAFQYSSDADTDFYAEFGERSESVTLPAMINLFKNEISREIITDLWAVSGANAASFDKNNPTAVGLSRNDHYGDLAETIRNVSGQIYDATQRAEANWMMVDTKASTVIQTARGFVGDPYGDHGKFGMKKIGMFAGMPVYHDHFLKFQPGAAAEGNIMLGYKGTSFFDAGYVYAPYQPIQITATATLADFLHRKAMRSRYAKKVVNAKMYKKLSIVAS